MEKESPNSRSGVRGLLCEDCSVRIRTLIVAMKENIYRLIILRSFNYMVVKTYVSFHINISIYMPDIISRIFTKIKELNAADVQNVHYSA